MGEDGQWAQQPGSAGSASLGPGPPVFGEAAAEETQSAALSLCPQSQPSGGGRLAPAHRMELSSQETFLEVIGWLAEGVQ